MHGVIEWIEGSVWTAGQNDLSQYLQIDLGKQYNISAIGTQGRQHTKEFVQEFKLETGIDGHDFSVYRDRNGNIKVWLTRHRHKLNTSMIWSNNSLK
jgi:hypothetical protein